MDLVYESPSYASFTERACTEHPEKWISMVCMTCKEAFVCLTCISRKHKGHVFSEIEEFLQIKNHLLTKLTLEVNAKMKRLEARIDRVQRAKADNAKNSQEIVDFIEDRAANMKREIDKITSDYVQQCRTIEKNNGTLLVHLEDRMTKHYRDLKDTSTHSTNVLETDNYIEFSAVEKRLRFENDRQYDKFPKLFKAGIVMSDKQTRVMTQFGYMDKSDWTPDGCKWGGEREEMDVTGEIQPFRVELKSAFILPKQKQIHSTCPIDNDQAWLVCTGSNEAEMKSRKGATTGLLQTREGVKINDIHYSPERDRTLCCAQGSVRKVLAYGKYQVLFRTDFYASSICEAFEDGHLLVCHDEKGQIIKYNLNGDMKKVIVNDLDGLRLFAWPRKVRVNLQNGDMAVIDEATPRHVVILDENLDELCRYYGGVVAKDNTTVITSASRDDPDTFHPRDICFDVNGDVVIADYGKNAVMVIDREGREVRTIWRDEVPPTSIGLQPDGMVWIGFLDGSVKVVKYL